MNEGVSEVGDEKGKGVEWFSSGGRSERTEDATGLAELQLLADSEPLGSEGLNF